MFFYVTLTEGPGVARDKKFFKKFLKNYLDFFSLLHSPATRGVHKKFQHNRSSRLVGYNQHTIYTNVLFYDIVNSYLFSPIHYMELCQLSPVNLNRHFFK